MGRVGLEELHLTEFYLDDDWNMVKAPVTPEDIARWATAYQKKYFPDCQPDVKIFVNESPKFYGAGCFVPDEMAIHISGNIAPFEGLTKIALLHEMIHIKLHADNGDPDENHGPRFKAEVKRLMSEGAYDNLL